MTNPYEAPTTGQANSSENEALKKDAQQALIFSIVGIICCAPLAIVGIIKGNNVKKQIAATGQGQAHHSNANIAVIVGWVAIALWAVGLIVNLAAMA